ncbi:heme/hemin ABC transporter substrate-binding protein [Polymorphospora rubra]|uniref:ABC transporter substrate-binding protein n=1 Tax=Polymorphospora rubra TaxID=338584 RepID=A0A810NB17_9ACTN|nr:ABC transporter substrate-binding protein [Polymorphospora rubra]BCJ70280.1 ABC transporter substrate-binding protein [Polymorphospora rubra]
MRSPRPAARRLIAALGGIALLAVTACAPAPTGAASTVDPAVGCGPTTARLPDQDVTPVDQNPPSRLPVTVTSADGGDVTVTDASRILPVNLYGSIAEIVFSLGLGDRVVGRDTSTTLAAAAHLPVVTPAGHDLSGEAILRLDPSVVIADRSIGPPEVFNQLRRSGIPVVLIDDEQTLPAISRHIRTIAAALGVPGSGAKLVARVEGEIAAARRQAPPGRPLRIAFLYLRGTAGVYLMGGKGAGSDEMIRAIGAVDAGTEIGLERFRPLTSEGLINAAPDVILVMTHGLESVKGVDGLVAMPGVGQTPAGRNRRVVDMDDGLLLNFGARTGPAIAALAEAVYGECQ